MLKGVRFCHEGQDQRVKVAILAVPEVTASALHGMFDLSLLRAGTGRSSWRARLGAQSMHPYIVAQTSGGFQAANALLLGAAGLLTNCEATIPWGYASNRTNDYTGVKVRMDQALVLSGEAQRIIMAGGESSWQDLALFLIARFAASSSISAYQAIHFEPVYSASKHAVNAFLYALRRQVLDYNIRVGALAPATVLNELWGHTDETVIAQKIGKREGLRSEEAALFILSRPRHVAIRDLVMLPQALDLEAVVRMP